MTFYEEWSRNLESLTAVSEIDNLHQLKNKELQGEK